MKEKLIRRLRAWLNSETVRDFARGMCQGFAMSF